MKLIYLDNAATTPVLNEVVEAVADCLRNYFGNPSSLHRLGIKSEKLIKEAADSLAAVLHVAADELIFTSGGTEANNMAILGTALARQRAGRHLITTAIEHPSVLRVFEHLEAQSFEVTYLPVDNSGLVSSDRLEKEIRPDTILVSIMHINNEIGSIQPIEELGRIIKGANPNTVFHVDAIQSFGKLELYPRKWSVDLMSLSGHKIHGPKGIGALYIRKGVRLQPILFGGGQQRGYRSGTENLAGIAGLGVAAKFIRHELENRPVYLYELKNRLLSGLKDALPQAVINGSLESGAPHIVNIGFPGLKGEVVLHALEDEGVFVSTGSACSSRDRTVSHVLKAIGVDDRVAGGSIRVSTSYLTTKDEIDAFIRILASVVSRVEKYSRR